MQKYEKIAYIQKNHHREHGVPQSFFIIYLSFASRIIYSVRLHVLCGEYYINYQIEARFSGAMYNESFSVIPKASYHALM